ncbi:hydrogenase expression/formation protein HypE [Thiomicrospira microaerophila]|uniref:hydrogenase expression/formation protein HypE n=1 Tax=Thiomicrospira microaerophila TaxID=406020 RepID=UPI00200D1E2A|nr:hydrogenase expression/formation protein HypE [Thiomicrospira microaerophila]UQB42508.1 hydrogenase expression/formation protein HypE [Thiomicrospira microaerophila]
MKSIQLSQGGGGLESQTLIQNLFYRHFNNPILAQAEDAALIECQGQTAFTTDSYTVNPLFFQGGDIGKLAVIGTLNDLAMRTARPGYLSAGFIIEEGLAYADLERIVASMAQAIAEADCQLVCGDTKVVPKGAVDKLFINTSGIGAVQTNHPPALNRIQPGDALIVSGDLGRHGAVIMAARGGLDLNSDLQTDCALLWPLVEALLNAGIELHALRDATRGGLATVLNEWAQASGLGLAIEESQLPICEPVQGLCELLGFEAYDLANEGRMVIALPADQAEAALRVLRQFDISQNAAHIGEVNQHQPGQVIIQTAWGTQRRLHWPNGELLPRIC